MTIVKIKQLFFGLLLVAVALPAAAQVSDLQSWHRVSIGGDLTKDLSLSVEQQVRLFDNSSRVDQTFTEIDLGYNLPKGFELDIAYRFSWNQERGGYFSNRHRYNLDISYSEKFWRLKGKVRARFQHRPSPSLFNERFEPDDSPLVARLKAGVDVRKLGDWTPGIEFEAFFRLDNPIERGFTTMRYRVSLDYDLPKRMELGIFYMLETEYSDQTPAYISVVGINYAYEWKRPKKKKKKDKDKE